MYEVRNAGYLEASFSAGDSVTDYIYSEIKKRRPDWNANALHFLELKGGAQFTFTMDGWDWTAVNGCWTGSNCVIRDLVVNQAVTGLKMAFRYDD